MKKIYLLSSFLTLLTAANTSVKAQVITVFNDNFDRATFTTGTSYGTPPTLYTFTLGGTSTIGTTFVSGTNYVANIVSGSTAQRALFYAPIAGYSAPFNTTLDLNPGVVTWTFNMQTSVAAATTSPLSGVTAGGIDLGGNMAGNIYNGAPTGYGVVFNSSATGGVCLVRFSGGMATNVPIITQTTTMPPTDYYSVKVTYNPATNSWSLFVRDDGATGFADPSSGVTLQQGTTVTDATYTGIALVNYGALYTFPAGTGTMSVDNYTVSVTLCNPAGTVTGNTGAICNGTTLSLSNTTGLPTGTWTSNNTAAATVGSTGTVYGTGPGTSTITYNVPFPCTPLSSTVVTVNPNPVITTSGSTTICTGTTTTLTGSPSSGTWSSSSNAIATVDGSGNVTGVTPGTILITYNSNSCTTTQSITVVSSPGPILGTASACQSATSALYDVIGSGTWASSIPGIATVDAFGNVTAIGTAGFPASSIITYTLPNGCFVSKLFTVNPVPTPFTVSGSNTTYCAGSASTANIVLLGSTSGVSYQLYNGPSTVGTALPGGSGALNFGIQSTPGTYTVAGTNTTTGCVSNMTSSVTVQIKPLPTQFTVTGGGSFCVDGVGSPVGLNGSSTGVSYKLFKDGSPLAEIIPGTGSPLNFGFQSVQGNYTVSATTTGSLPNCSVNMLGSAAIITNPLPDVDTVTGGGAYCTGGTGVAIGLDFSSTGVSYQLQNGIVPTGSPISGTGGPLSFGLQTTVSSSYNVVATNIATGCVSAMAGTASISIAPQPASFTVTGGGTGCAGTSFPIGLNGSNPTVNYQVYRGTTPVGSATPGIGDIITLDSVNVSGTYTVVATDQTYNCVSNMTGSVLVTEQPLPVVFNLSGGGGYCAGGAGIPITLTGSQNGIAYLLYYGVGFADSLHGTGGALNFGNYTNAGTYTVTAVNITSSCSSNMNGTAVIVENPLPVAYDITGGGAYCAGTEGIDIGLDLSAAGVNYQLYTGGLPTGALMPGTGSTLDFGFFTGSGTYTIVGTNPTTGCIANMSGSAVISVHPLPALHSVSGGGSYCSGDPGRTVSVGGSDAGISYQLYYGGTTAIGAPAAGTGSAINFGIQSLAGTYTVIATDTATFCSRNMPGGATIVENASPAVFPVTGGGVYCLGTPGMHIGLGGSNAGVNYALYYAGGAISTIPGSGSSLDFGLETASGTYTIVGTNPATGCSDTMSGNAVIIPKPLPTGYSVIGGGSYCSGSLTLPSVGLSNSTEGINYQLYRSGTATGGTTPGTGAAIDFGTQPAAGVYTVAATDTASGCTSTMPGSAAVTINSMPPVYTVAGGGGYCTGGTGFHIYLSNSSAGIQYQLYNGGTLASTIYGTGAGVDFGLQAAAGTYTAVAVNTTTGCTDSMAGSAIISINSLPAAFSVTVSGGGNYCVTGAGVDVGLSGSTSGVNYQLYNSGIPSGAALPGTGSAIDFGIHAAGNYTVIGNNTATGCTNNMAGSGVVTAIPLPDLYILTGGGNYCSTGLGLHVGLSGSDAGTVYQLYRDATTIGAAVTGTSGPVDFGLFTEAGTYTVIATNGGATGCANNMSGTSIITVYPVSVPSVSIATATGSDTSCLGNIAHLTASSINGGSLPIYDWMVNGVVSGAGSTYSYLPTDGDMVTVLLHSNGICVIPDTVSRTIRMTVTFPELPTVNVSVSPGDVICEGAPVTCTGTSTFGGSSPIYTWIVNSTYIAGTGLTYSYTPANGDIIMLRMVSNFPCRLADTIYSLTNVMMVDPPVIPIVTISADPGNEISAGQTTTFTATVDHSGSAPAYQWLINGMAVSGATSASFTSSTLNNNDSVTCVVTGGCDLQGFNSVRMHVSNVGVQQIAAGNSISLVPNPNKGSFVITGTFASGGDEEVSIEITNMLGQVVYRNRAMTHGGVLNERVEMNNSQANGIYILTLRSDGQNSVFHFVAEQ